MGKASSAKKVARAASTGESRRPGERRLIGFPAAVVVTLVLGVLLVAFAASSRDAAPTPTLQDHWHSAYGVYDCQADGFLEPLNALTDANGNAYDPDGIHSHDDGLIHIHPFTSSVTGDDATLAVFFETVGITMTDDTLTLADGRTFTEAGTTCNDEPAVLQIARWRSAVAADGNEPDDVYTDDFDDISFLNDGEAFTIALAPEGADIPVPEAIPRLLTVNPTLIDPSLNEDSFVDPDADAETDTGDVETGDVETDPSDEADTEG